MGASIESILVGVVPDFAIKVRELLQKCTEDGINMRPIEGLRSLQTQAKYWVEGRTIEIINEKIKSLNSVGATYISSLIEEAKEKIVTKGNIITKALPGQSLHQYGEAVDCAAIDDQGKIDWTNKYAFKQYAIIAQGMGLDSGYFWKIFTDRPHVQFRAGNIASLFGLKNIKDINDYWKAKEDQGVQLNK